MTEEITEKTISLAGADISNLTGVKDENLNLIKDNFDSLIILRGDALYLKGDAIEVNRIEKIFNELIFLQKRQGQISTNDINLVLSLTEEEPYKINHFKERFGISSGEINEVILFRKNDVIKPKTETQYEYMKQVRENDIIFAIGPAGTGKTYLAVAFAIAALKNKEVNKIILARPAVEAGESLGFLPGDLAEKIDPYLKPLFDALEDMLPFDKLKTYLERNVVEIIPLAYMRGRTLNNAFVILDEAQNATSTQMKMFLTRLGVNSKAIITGDVTQIDLPPREISGLVEIQDVLKGIDDIAFVYFNKSDVVRHKLVKDIINAYEKYKGS